MARSITLLIGGTKKHKAIKHSCKLAKLEYEDKYNASHVHLGQGSATRTLLRRLLLFDPSDAAPRVF